MSEDGGGGLEVGREREKNQRATKECSRAGLRGHPPSPGLGEELAMRPGSLSPCGFPPATFGFQVQGWSGRKVGVKQGWSLPSMTSEGQQGCYMVYAKE